MTSPLQTLTPEQSRGARGLLDLSQKELAARTFLSESTVRDFETGRRGPSHNDLVAIRRALEVAGAKFFDPSGVSIERVIWRDVRRKEIPPNSAKVVVQYVVGKNSVQSAYFDADSQEWELAATGERIPAAKAGRWAPGPWLYSFELAAAFAGPILSMRDEDPKPDEPNAENDG